MSAINDIKERLQNPGDQLRLAAADYSDMEEVKRFFERALSDNVILVRKKDGIPLVTSTEKTVSIVGKTTTLGFSELDVTLVFEEKDGWLDIRMDGSLPLDNIIHLPIVSWITIVEPGLSLALEGSLGLITWTVHGALKIGDETRVPIAVTKLNGDSWRLDAAIVGGALQLPDIASVANLTGGRNLDSFVPNELATSIKGLALTGISATFDPVAGSLSYFSLGLKYSHQSNQSADQSGQWEIAPKVQLQDLAFALILINPITPTNQTEPSEDELAFYDVDLPSNLPGYDKLVIGVVSGAVIIGGTRIPMYVRASVGSSATWAIGILPGNDVTLPNLADILTLAGDDELLKTLPDGLRALPRIVIHNLEITFTPSRKALDLISFHISSEASWPIIEGYFAIDHLDVQLNLTDLTDAARRNVTGVVDSIFQIGDCYLQISAQRDVGDEDWSITGGLPPGESVSLTEIAAKLLGEHVAIPAEVPDIRFSQVSITVVPKTKQFTFAAGSTYRWSITPKFAVENFNLDFNYQAQRASNPVSGAIGGVLQIAGVELRLAAALNKSAAGGWDFSGSSGDGQKIHLGSLVEEILEKFVVAGRPLLPAAIRELTVENLAVTFNTSAKDFTFRCKSHFPMSDDGKETGAITIALALLHTSGGYRMECHLEVNVANLAAPLKFDLTLLSEEAQGKTSDLFVATYNHAGGEQKLNIGALIRSIAQGSPDWISALDGFEIDLKDAILAFIKTATDKKFLFGLDIGAEISLAQLPLVGKEFPTDRKVGIDDLRILVASKPFSVAEVKKLNGLIPTGVAKLPDVSQNAGAQNASSDDANTIALKQGLNVSATLKLGDLTRNLSLPVVAGGSPQTTGSPATTSTTQAATTTDNASWLKIQKSLGPVHFERVGAHYKDAAVWFLLDAALAAAGLTLSLDGLSIGSPLSKFEPRFELRGLGIDYRNDALEIGGAFLKIADKEYAGAAVIKAKQLTLSALGMYKEMADGHPSVFVYAVLDYPIGGPSFFFVTGLAAGFGYSRALKIPTIDKVASFSLVENARKGAGMPKDIGAELQKLRDDITPAAGENFLAIGVKFTSFKIVDSFALLTVSFGSHFELNLLGLSNLVAPANAGPNVPPVAEAQLALKASFLPDRGFLGVQAQLTPNSYLLSKACHLTGGFAFYSWFAGSEHDGDFVLTLGGYHPHFRAPEHYPNVPRLGFNWQVSPELSLKGDAYFALTASALMAGGHLEANWRSGSVHAWFKLGADFLIAWKPYHYEITVYVDMGVEVTFEFFGTQHISIDVGADLSIWGPEFSGEATIHLWVISFTVKFGAAASHSPSPIDWPVFKSSFLPADKDVCSIAVTGGVIGKDSQDASDLGVINPKHFSLATNSVVPSTTAQYALKDAKRTIALSRPPGQFGIGSMAVAAADLTSTQTITIKREGDFAGGDFEYTPIFKNVPTGLWGESLTPEVNGKQFVENALSGFEIHPKTKSKLQPGGETAAIERRKLQDSGFSGTGEYRWESVKTFAAAPFDSEQKRRDELRKTLVAGAASRNAILAALGFTPDDLGKITLSAAQADDFLIAPQIEQSVRS